MKTKFNFRLIAAAIVFAAVMTSFNAEAQKREYRKDDHKKHEKYGRMEDRRTYNDSRDRDRDRHVYDVKKHKKDYTYRYDRPNRYEYHHPKYGHVYRKFHSTPVRMRHTQGDFYFYGGNYYRHYHGIGYVRVELPRNVIFVDLPFRVERVRHGNLVYYRHGDMYFERCEHGYRPAPRIGIQLSAHF